MYIKFINVVCHSIRTEMRNLQDLSIVKNLEIATKNIRGVYYDSCMFDSLVSSKDVLILLTICTYFLLTISSIFLFSLVKYARIIWQFSFIFGLKQDTLAPVRENRPIAKLNPNKRVEFGSESFSRRQYHQQNRGVTIHLNSTSRTW